MEQMNITNEDAINLICGMAEQCKDDYILGYQYQKMWYGRLLTKKELSKHLKLYLEWKKYEEKIGRGGIVLDKPKKGHSEVSKLLYNFVRAEMFLESEFFVQIADQKIAKEEVLKSWQNKAEADYDKFIDRQLKTFNKRNRKDKTAV